MTNFFKQIIKQFSTRPLGRNKEYKEDGMLQIFRQIKGHYNDRRAEENKSVDSAKAMMILDAFGKFYDAKVTSNEEEYYLGNLISTGRVEGTLKEVLGTVPEAIARTRTFFKGNDIHAHQASSLIDNVINVLDKENFNQAPSQILNQQEVQIFQDMAAGNI